MQAHTSTTTKNKKKRKEKAWSRKKARTSHLASIFFLYPPPSFPHWLYHTLTHNFCSYKQTEKNSHQPEPALQEKYPISLQVLWVCHQSPQVFPWPLTSSSLVLLQLPFPWGRQSWDLLIIKLIELSSRGFLTTTSTFGCTSWLFSLSGVGQGHISEIKHVLFRPPRCIWINPPRLLCSETWRQEDVGNAGFAGTQDKTQVCSFPWLLILPANNTE